MEAIWNETISEAYIMMKISRKFITLIENYCQGSVHFIPNFEPRFLLTKITWHCSSLLNAV